MPSGDATIGIDSRVDDTLVAMRHAARALTSPTASQPDELRAMMAARDALDAAITEGLAEMEATRGFEVEDASSLAVWAARELQMGSAEARARVRTAHALRDLPEARSAYARGLMSFAHARLFEFAMRHVGRDETIALEPVLVGVATAAEPAELKKVVRHTKAVQHPDELDEAWIRGMEARDLHVSKFADGWFVNGFLPIHVGARLDAVLTSFSVPREAGDTRTAAQRRVDGLDLLLTRVLADGLPTDGTVVPQIHVVVDAGTLQAALVPAAEPLFTPHEPAMLVGFGRIGRRLLAHLTCGAALTPILVEDVELDHTVLDVGRAERAATRKQRRAVWLEQGGTCDTSHCRNSIDHIHHRWAWSAGGPTDMANLVGLCHACHVYTHARDGTGCAAA